MEVLFMGTGASTGVPMIGCDCSVCQSSDPKNERTRSSIMVRVDGKNILVDTSPDLRIQSLKNHIKRIDAVIFTHPHALLPEVSDNQAKDELCQAKKLLEDWIAAPVEVFAYPNGAFRKGHFPLLEQLGFRAAFSVMPGVNRRETDRWILRRTEVSGRDSLRDFMHKMRGGLDLWQGLYQSVKGFYR